MKYFNYYIFFIFLLLNSCQLIDEEEKIPSYIHVEKVTLTTDYSKQGSASEKITEAWLSIDDNLLGIFELPFTVPVLKTGKYKITIRAGIKNNGISASRRIYPFYKEYEIETDLIAGEISTIEPRITYKEEAKFVWKEDFEDAGISLDTLNNSTVDIEKTNTNIFEGKYALKSMFNNENKILECSTIDSDGSVNGRFYRPDNSGETYLEMNYKNNMSFTIGMYYFLDGSPQYMPVMSLLPKDDWNKIYIDFTEILTHYTNINNYHLYIYASKDSTETELNPELYFDNFKLIHF